MRLHEQAVQEAARAVKLARYQSHTVSDEDLVRLAVTVYKERVSYRGLTPYSDSRRTDLGAEPKQ